MQFRRRLRSFDGEAGILPLINVVFLLLIFFMLAGRLSAGEPFAVAPPVSQAAAAAELPRSEAPREAAVALAADGRLALNGETLDAGALRAAVAAALAQRPDMTVSLRADGAAEAARVVAVMEALRDAGVRRLQLFARPGAASRGGTP